MTDLEEEKRISYVRALGQSPGAANLAADQLGEDSVLGERKVEHSIGG